MAVSGIQGLTLNNIMKGSVVLKPSSRPLISVFLGDVFRHTTLNEMHLMKKQNI